ncbi:helix-turn-helix domain-containing protein [Kitasatospora sp. NPDC002551]|uniref:winged helix-turn-helix transcriptional regulator n=1 Tax=unclassified Kitasatospora TaxID=2633591 RepID=UPI0033197D36
MTTDSFLADCRARLAFDLLANTWNAVVLWALRDGPLRPVELRERIGGISSKVLTETLHRLRFNGLVERHALPGAPPRVEYRLTALGRTFLAPIDAVGAWAFEHGDEVMAAQERAEARPQTRSEARRPIATTRPGGSTP